MCIIYKWAWVACQKMDEFTAYSNLMSCGVFKDERARRVGEIGKGPKVGRFHRRIEYES